MKSIKIIYLIITFTQIGNGFARGDSTFHKALNLERLIMENAKNDSLKKELLLQKAILFRDNGEYILAVQTLKRITQENIRPFLRSRVASELAVNSYFLQNHSEAIVHIAGVDSSFVQTKQELVVLKMILLLENNLIDDFRDYFLLNLNSKDSIFVRDFNNSMTSLAAKDPNHYRRLSSVFPGLGLLKSGHIGYGVMNLSLEVFFATFAAFNFYNGYIFTGLFSGAYPFYRFYSGGKALTFSTIEKDNLKQENSIKLRGYKYIQSYVRK